MTLYVVVLYDRHVDDTITVHKTREGADRTINDYMSAYEPGRYEWHERTYGQPEWCRYVETDDDGPTARIEITELQD